MAAAISCCPCSGDAVAIGVPDGHVPAVLVRGKAEDVLAVGIPHIDLAAGVGGREGKDHLALLIDDFHLRHLDVLESGVVGGQQHRQRGQRGKSNQPGDVAAVVNHGVQGGVQENRVVE